jgi:hypothetical protein
VDDLDGSFSFTVENEDIDREGTTVFDVIPIRSVIKIYEGDLEHPAFVGIIRRRHIGVSMTAQGVKRTITFSGKSVISLIAEYTVLLDIKIPGVAEAMIENQKLTHELQNVKNVAEFLQISWEFFKKVSVNVNKNPRQKSSVANTEVAEILSKFAGKNLIGDIITVDEGLNVHYNIATIFFNAANNTLVDVWRNLLCKPVYEIFSYCDKEGKPKVMIRQVPYGCDNPKNGDWSKLDIYEISPVSLTAYELDQNDEEVYTFFASYIIGSVESREFYVAASHDNQKDQTIQWNEEKTAVYGFRPLQMNFMGYDRSGNTENKDGADLPGTLEKINKQARYWYSRLDDMYAGTITICTDFNRPETNPRVGCRARFMGGEFYINKTDHAWNFGGTPTIKLTVSRGMRYDKEGILHTGEAGIIPNVGGRYRELEKG